MSTCISMHGEFGSHVMSGYNADRFVCQRCGVLDEDALMAAADAAEEQIARANSVLREFINVRGDFYEPRPLAAMIEQVALSLGFELRKDWRAFADQATEPTP